MSQRPTIVSFATFTAWEFEKIIVGVLNNIKHIDMMLAIII
jgi:hypothetical protein